MPIIPNSYRRGHARRKRIFDVVAASLLMALLLPFACLIAIAVKLLSRGSVFHTSERIGVHGSSFTMLKFRTMRKDTPQVATHLLERPEQYLTPIGAWLRRTSIDEIPQLFNVIRGDMSLVGPRPALFNQNDLIELRASFGVDSAKPGVTGWAQINGRDDLPIPTKVEFDVEYMARQSLLFDLKILVGSVTKVLGAKGVTH